MEKTQDVSPHQFHGYQKMATASHQEFTLYDCPQTFIPIESLQFSCVIYIVQA